MACRRAIAYVWSVSCCVAMGFAEPGWFPTRRFVVIPPRLHRFILPIASPCPLRCSTSAVIAAEFRRYASNHFRMLSLRRALAQCQPVAVFPRHELRFYRLVREHLAQDLSRRTAAEYCATRPDKCAISPSRPFLLSPIVPVVCAVNIAFVSPASCQRNIKSCPCRFSSFTHRESKKSTALGHYPEPIAQVQSLLRPSRRRESTKTPPQPFSHHRQITHRLNANYLHHFAHSTARAWNSGKSNHSFAAVAPVRKWSDGPVSRRHLLGVPGRGSPSTIVALFMFAVPSSPTFAA